jgi:hypothetical protein
MRAAQLCTVTAMAAVLIGYGWGEALITDLALILGGVFAGHVLTELLNDPTE